MMIFFILIVAFVRCDLPVHCVWPDMKGTWTFKMTDNIYNNTVTYKECDKFEDLPFPVKDTIRITLEEPNKATNEETGKVGIWTTVYDQGMEINIDGTRWFAFFKYQRDENDGTSKSICNEIWTGWFHDSTYKPGEYPVDWGCFSGSLPSNQAPKTLKLVNREFSIPTQEEIDEINNSQDSWVATKYSDEFYERTFAAFRNKPSLGRSGLPRPKVPQVKDLPDSWDWRDVEGTSYVSPVRNQGGCGSCYAFGATGMHEARARILSKNAWQPIFSPQEVLDCDPYSQACAGGFPFSVGRHGEDMGIVEEHCDTYIARGKTCPDVCKKKEERTFLFGTQYVGGYFGACSEKLMLQEIYDNGPLAVCLDMPSELFSYKSGIYRHTGGQQNWEETDHSVLAVGWGQDGNGEKYWILKNSWGSYWGDHGYFKIVRGEDHCAIESMAVKSTVVYNP